MNAGLILDFLTIACLNIEQPLRTTLAKVLFLFDLTRKKRTAKEMRSWVCCRPPNLLLFERASGSCAGDSARELHSCFQLVLKGPSPQEVVSS